MTTNNVEFTVQVALEKIQKLGKKLRKLECGSADRATLRDALTDLISVVAPTAKTLPTSATSAAPVVANPTPPVVQAAPAPKNTDAKPFGGLSPTNFMLWAGSVGLTVDNVLTVCDHIGAARPAESSRVRVNTGKRMKENGQSVAQPSGEFVQKVNDILQGKAPAPVTPPVVATTAPVPIPTQQTVGEKAPASPQAQSIVVSVAAGLAALNLDGMSLEQLQAKAKELKVRASLPTVKNNPEALKKLIRQKIGAANPVPAPELIKAAAQMAIPAPPVQTVPGSGHVGPTTTTVQGPAAVFQLIEALDKAQRAEFFKLLSTKTEMSGADTNNFVSGLKSGDAERWNYFCFLSGAPKKGA